MVAATALLSELHSATARMSLKSADSMPSGFLVRRPLIAGKSIPSLRPSRWAKARRHGLPRQAQISPSHLVQTKVPLSFVLWMARSQPRVPRPFLSASRQRKPYGEPKCNGLRGESESGELVPVGVNTAPLSITGLALSNLTNHSVTISWTTNVPATSQVLYGVSPLMDQQTPRRTPTKPTIPLPSSDSVTSLFTG